MDIKIIVVEKTGTLKETLFKKFDIDQIYKKANLKKSEGFELQTVWDTKINNTKYIVELYAKKNPRAGMENKYDFPPPVDNDMYSGSCVLVCKDNDNNYMNLTLDIWKQIYEKLFGGFENLDQNASEDEDEIDELDDVPLEMKTSSGFLKDDFVVDDDEEDEEDDDEEDENSVHSSETIESNEELLEEDDDDENEMFDELGSELSEEMYNYSDDDL